MILAPLLAIRARLKADADLSAYLMAKYGVPGRFVVGQFKPQNIETDYPYFSFNVQGELRDAADVKREQALNIYWAIHRPETDPADPDLYRGVAEIAAIGNLIEQCLFAPSSPHQGYRLKHEGETYTDFAVNFPFFAAAATFTVQIPTAY